MRWSIIHSVKATIASALFWQKRRWSKKKHATSHLLLYVFFLLKMQVFYLFLFWNLRDYLLHSYVGLEKTLIIAFLWYSMHKVLQLHSNVQWQFIENLVTKSIGMHNFSCQYVIWVELQKKVFQPLCHFYCSNLYFTAHCNTFKVR